MSDNTIANKNLSSKVDEFMNKLSRQDANNEKVPGRIIFSLDATASRSVTWDIASDIQIKMFSEAEMFGNLLVQLVYYRGFDQCKSSKWLSSANNLKILMNKVSVLPGRTQISRVLKHAIKENKKIPVNALVFIGDTLEEEIDILADLSGQLGVYGVPIFIFHEGNNVFASDAFKYICKLSKGAYFPFDHSSPEVLKDLLGAIGIYATGGLEALIKNEGKFKTPLKILTKQLKVE